jgi:hypothetical protein
MNRTTRSGALALALWGCLTTPASAASPLETATPAVAQPAAPARLRTDDPLLTALVNEAARRSSTFRSLLTLLEASDGIVWIEDGKCGHGVRACLHLWIRQAGPNRLLRIVVNRSGAALDVMASLGHELQHALELLSDRTATTDAGAYLFFQRTAAPAGDVFETQAAIRTGNLVRSELRAPQPAPRTNDVLRLAYLRRPELLYE